MKKWLHKKFMSKIELILLLAIVAVLFMMYGGLTILKIGIRSGVVSGTSMEKTLTEGTRLLFVDYKFKEIKRGDIVSIFVKMNGKNANIIKRVIALPNETIHIQGNRVYINGNLLEEPYAYYIEDSEDNLTLTLKENEYFVMGDNRIISQDSRTLGGIPKDFIVGIVIKIKETKTDFNSD